MTSELRRRDFLKSSAAIVGLGSSSATNAVHAAPGTMPRALVPLRREIEPLVRLIEETPREKIIPVVAGRLKKGLSYRQLLAAVYLTALRNNTSGHHVFMMHSVHQTGLSVHRNDRLLPLMWALDCVKSPRKTRPRLKPIKSGSLPAPGKAAEYFEKAMTESDFETAERAIVAVARSRGPKPAYDLHWRWGAARNGGTAGGHAAIGVSNSYRTLNAIGWQHAEPVLRYAILSSIEDEGNGGLRLVNAKRAKRAVSKLPAGWAGGKSDKGAVLEIMARFRESNTAADCVWVFDRLLNGKLNAATVWDALLLYSGEQMIRYKIGGHSGRPLHAVTMSNALHYSFRTCRDPELRLYVLLEAIHWSTVMNATIDKRGLFRSLKITEIPQVETPKSARDAVDEIFALLPPLRFGHWYQDKTDQDKAMRLAYAFATKQTDHRLFFQTARHYLCRKSSLNAHDLKFPVALFENCRHISREWRPNLLASAVYYLHGPRTEDNAVVRQVKNLQ